MTVSATCDLRPATCDVQPASCDLRLAPLLFYPKKGAQWGVGSVTDWGRRPEGPGENGFVPFVWPSCPFLPDAPSSAPPGRCRAQALERGGQAQGEDLADRWRAGQEGAEAVGQADFEVLPLEEDVGHAGADRAGCALRHGRRTEDGPHEFPGPVGVEHERGNVPSSVSRSGESVPGRHFPMRMFPTPRNWATQREPGSLQTS